MGRCASMPQEAGGKKFCPGPRRRLQSKKKKNNTEKMQKKCRKKDSCDMEMKAVDLLVEDILFEEDCHLNAPEDKIEFRCSTK